MTIIAPLSDTDQLRPLFIQWQQQYSRIFLLTDQNTHTFCLPLLRKNYPDFVDALCILPPFEDGEQHKTIKEASQIWQGLHENFADRRSLLINLGGGLLGDLGGWAAANYMRGIDFVQIPTTLLAQVDAAAGGKTAINFAGIKNLVGAFFPPLAVLVCPEWLQTLAPQQIASGFAEMLKHALLDSREHWAEICQYKQEEIPPLHLIRRSIELKARITQQDPKEQGLRKILNLGHTIAHAVESLSHKEGRKPILHGEAVAIGLFYECRLAALVGTLPQQSADEICTQIQKLYPIPPYSAADLDILLQLMRADKKNERQTLLFVLLAEIGKPVFDQKISAEQVRKALIFSN